MLSMAQVTDPEDACEAVQPPGLDKPWIALVVRSRKEHPSCTFDTKVSRYRRAPWTSPVMLRWAGPNAGLTAGSLCAEPNDRAQLMQAAVQRQRRPLVGADTCIVRDDSAEAVKQVRFAQLAGAVAVIVYDDVVEVKTSSLRQHPITSWRQRSA